MNEEEKLRIWKNNLLALGSEWSSKWVIHVETPEQAENVIRLLDQLQIKVPHSNSSILELGDPNKWPPFITLTKYRSLPEGSKEKVLYNIKHEGTLDKLQVCIDPVTANWAEASICTFYGKELKSYSYFMDFINKTF